MEKILKISVVFFGIFALLRLLGLALTYTNNLTFHSIGNFLYIVFTFYILIPAILILIFMFYKKASFSIILLPLVFILGILLVYTPLTFNSIILGLNGLLVAYSIFLLAKK